MDAIFKKVEDRWRIPADYVDTMELKKLKRLKL